MRKLLLGLCLFLVPSFAMAQCNGIFPASNVCGTTSSGANIPGPLPLSSFALAPGGSSGNVQTNNGSGGLAGITNAQLTALINTVTSSLSGTVPAYPNDVTKFFRGDGAYAVPPTFGSGASGYVPASGGSSTSLFLNQAGTFTAPSGGATITNVYNVETYGAKADLLAFQDGAITALTATFNSASATFSSADIGKIIAVRGAGTAGALLTTTIAAYGGNPHQVSLTIVAGTTVSGANYAYSTDSTPGIQAAANLAMVSGGDVAFNFSGQYGVTSINLTNPTKSIRLLGVGPLAWGTHLIAMSNANAMIDATGHDAIQISNIVLGSGYPDGTDISRPNIGLLVGPSAAIHGIDVIRADNVRIVGYFGTATWYMDRIYGGTFANISSFQYLDSAASGFIMTGTNVGVVSSAFTTTCSATCNGTLGSFSFFRSEFHNFGFTPITRPSILMDNVVDTQWYGGLISGNGQTIVLGAGNIGLTFEGVQFSADNTTISSVFSGSGMDYLVTIQINSGGVTLTTGGAITHLTQIGRL